MVVTQHIRLYRVEADPIDDGKESLVPIPSSSHLSAADVTLPAEFCRSSTTIRDKHLRAALLDAASR